MSNKPLRCWTFGKLRSGDKPCSSRANSRRKVLARVAAAIVANDSRGFYTNRVFGTFVYGTRFQPSPWLKARAAAGQRASMPKLTWKPRRRSAVSWHAHLSMRHQAVRVVVSGDRPDRNQCQRGITALLSYVRLIHDTGIVYRETRHWSVRGALHACKKIAE